MTDLAPLFKLPSLAALYITEHGWTQGTEVNEQGHVCLTGALRLCSPIPGDGYIAREIFRRRDHAETWNDAGDRTRDEVVDYLAQSEITDAELEATFGPQWRETVEQVRTISGATTAQVESLAAALAATWDAALAAALDAALAAARDAALDAALAAALDAALAAARDAALAATWDAAWDAALDAAWALSVRDLIGHSGFTQEHYDLLTGPWRETFGQLHPDDAPLAVRP